MIEDIDILRYMVMFLYSIGAYTTYLLDYVLSSRGDTLTGKVLLILAWPVSMTIMLALQLIGFKPNK